jgi:serine/threonine protein kinase
MPDVQVLGKGAFGKVLLVKDKATKAIYAMKMLHKSVVLEREQVRDVGLSSTNSVVFSLHFPFSFHVASCFSQTDHTKSERHTLEEISHPFIVNLRFAFQTPKKLCVLKCRDCLHSHPAHHDALAVVIFVPRVFSYLVMDYCSGGELFFHLKHSGIFGISRSKL